MSHRLFAVLLALGVIVGLVAVPAAADDPSGTTIRYLSTHPRNTDLDLGASGFSAGDQQVFVNDAVHAGKRIGQEVGVCQIALASSTRLIATCQSSLVLRGGTLTTQGVFQEDPRKGPTGLTAAVTGGTGRYAGATGQSVGTFVPGTDDVNVVITLR
jgi:hypothetical protein